MPTKKDKIKINIGATVFIEEDGRTRPLVTCTGSNATTTADYEQVIKRVSDCIRKATAARKKSRR